MNKLKSHFQFNKQERSGIFFLLLIIVVLQIGYFLWMHFSANNSIDVFHLDADTQAQIDALKAKQQDSVAIYPFNPNYITDYKGYTLGMSVEEIDRLHNFRSTGKYVNSKNEFQQITKVSDSLLQAIAPYFKFPEWTQKSKKSPVNHKERQAESSGINTVEKGIKRADLNLATAEDLKSVNGIGEKLSARIVKFRNRLGGFLVKEQLNHVYGLEPEVVEKIFKQFDIKTIPVVKKININTASFDELTQLVYFNYELVRKIIDYRAANGRIVAFDELVNIEGFPNEKLEIIQLYLSLN